MVVQEEEEEEEERSSKLELRVTGLHLDGEDLPLRLFSGGLLVKQLHMI